MARLKQGSNLTAKLSISILGVLVLLFAATAGHAWHLKSAISAAEASYQKGLAKNQVPPKQLGDEALSKVPLIFEPNVGQTDSRVKFIARSSGYAAFLTGPSQAVLKIHNSDERGDDAISMSLVGANAKAKGGAIEQTAGVSQYYIGNDHSKWHENVANYLKVRYDEVYPGIDVVYQGDKSRFRYDFMLKPGADPKSVRMTFGGTQNVKIDPQGNLVLALANSDYYMSTKPVIYQESAGKKSFVDGNYVMNGKEIGFELGSYDPTQALVIDPNFTAGTYIGTTVAGIGSSVINGVANGGGSSFITGMTVSTSFPVVVPAGDVAAGGPLLSAGTYGGTGNDGDAFVTRINYAMSTAPTYSVYLGGASVDVGTGIGIDAAFNAVVVGYTQSGYCSSAPPNGCFPTLLGVEAPPPSASLGQHIFVTKFSGSNGVLVNSSVIYGSGTEKALGVAVQQSGVVHVTGSTSSTDLLTANYITPIKTIGSQKNLGGTGSTNAFYLQLTPSASTYTVTVGTYLGGFGFDSGNAIAIDPSPLGASVVIAGTSNSFGPGGNQFPCSADSACLTTGQSTGQTHAFVTQIATLTNASQTAGTFLNSYHVGSNANSEVGLATAIDYGSGPTVVGSPTGISPGNIYVGGAVSGAQWRTPGSLPPNATFTDAPRASGFHFVGTATPGATAQDGFALGITPTDVSLTGALVLAGSVVNGDEVSGNNGAVLPAGTVSLVTGMITDYLNQIYISGGTSNLWAPVAAGSPSALNNQAGLIRRRANAGRIDVLPPVLAVFPGFDVVAGSPFLHDFANQEQISTAAVPLLCAPLGPACYPEVTTLGDIPEGPATTTLPAAVLGAAPAATVGVGQANGVSFDQATNTGCFGGFVAQIIPMATTGAAVYGTINSVIQPTAFRNSAKELPAANNILAGGGPLPTPIYNAGVLGCASFNSDTVIESGGAVDNNPTFTFTMPVGGPAPTPGVTPPSNSFTLANFDPAFPVPTFVLGNVVYTPPALPAFTTVPCTSVNAPPGWLTCVQNGDTITMTVAPIADNFDPGIYIARFTVTPTQGDNAGVPELVTVVLNVTGALLTNSGAGGGIPFTVIPGCTVSHAPNGKTPLSVQGCALTVTNGPGGSVFADGKTQEVINIPVLSLVNGVLPLPPALIRFAASTINNGTPPSVGFLGDFLGDPAGAAEPTNLPGPGGVVGCPNGGGGTFIASSGACDLQITIDANTFNTVPNGTYTNSLVLSTNGLFSPTLHAPEDSLIVIDTTPITFNVTVNNNALLYLGPGVFSEFSSPECLAPGSSTIILPCPGMTTISEIDTLDSINLNTLTSVAYTAASAPAPGFLCAAGPATQGIPLASNPANGGSGFNFGNNGDLPASNVGEPNTQIAYPVSVANPGQFPQGIYATTVTVTVPSVINPTTGLPVTATRTYCLTVGTWISVSINTPELPTGVPPLYLEAGTPQNQGNNLQSFLNVTAFGSTVAQPFPPGPVGVPFGIVAAPSNATNEPWLSLDTGATCFGGGFTFATFCLDSAPPLITPAHEYDPAYVVAGCASVACYNAGINSVVVPPLAPGPTVPNSPPNPAVGGTGPTNAIETFIFRIQLTSGDTLQLFTDYSLFANCAAYPQGGGSVPPGPSEGNLVTAAQLTGETVAPYTTFPQAAPCPPGANGGIPAFSVDPVDTTGQGGPDLPAGITPYGPGVMIQYYTVAGTGVYTMQDGTPAGVDQLHEACPVGGFMWPCQNVYLSVSGGFPASLPHVEQFFPLPGTAYNVTSVPFLLGTRPQLPINAFPHSGAGGNCTAPAVPPIFPVGFECIEQTIINRPVADSLAQGIYHESFYTGVVNSVFPFDIPQPPAVVYVDLVVTGPPTVTVTPNPVTFTYNIGAPATVPPSQGVVMAASGPSAPIGFTMTPQSGSATVLLNGAGAAVNGCITSAGLTDCRGHALTLTATIGNLASLTTPGAFGGQLAVNIPLVNPVTGFPNAPVANPSFSIPVNVIVASPPTITITSSATAPTPDLDFNWTVGQANVTLVPGSTNQFTLNLSGSDVVTITSNHPNWIAIDGAASVTQVSTSQVHTVTIIGENVAGGLPTSPSSGQDLGTITATGLSTETAAIGVIVNVAQEPTVTIGGFSNPDNITYFSGDTDAATPGTTATISVGVTSTPENPTYSITAKFVYTPASPAGWCSISPNPVTVNNTPTNVTLTVTPAEAGFVVGTTYSCAITFDPAAVVPTTLVVNVNVQSQSLNNPGPITFNLPTSPTGPLNAAPYTQNIAMTGHGTYMYNTTDQVVTPAGGTWLTTGSVQMTKGAGTMVVTANDGGTLGTPPDAPGTYGGTIAYTGPVGFSIPFNTLVTMNVGTIGAAPTSVTFPAHYLGYTPIGTTTVALTSPPATLAFTLASDSAWLSCKVNTNTTPATLTITYDPTKAALGANSGNCNVSTTFSTAVLAVPVNLTVNPEPTLVGDHANPGSPFNQTINLVGTLGGTNPSANLVVSAIWVPAVAGQTLTFNVGSITSNPSWLQVTPLTGSTSAAGTPLLITANLAALGPNATPSTLDGSFTVSSPTASNVLNVSVILVTQNQPTITVGPAETWNWTVGQAGATLTGGGTSGQLTVGIAQLDTITVSSDQPWVLLNGAATVKIPQSTSTVSSSVITVTINTAALPTTAGNVVANVTATGGFGEHNATTVTVAVAGKPVVNFGSFANPDAITYYAGDPDPVVPTVPVGVTNTPENPSFALTASTDQPWCAATNPGSVNNTAGSMTVTLTPKEALLIPGAYACHVTIAGGASITASVLTINLSIGPQTLNNPGSITFNVPSNGTQAFTQNILMTGNGTFTFNTTPTVVTPTETCPACWLATGPVSLIKGGGVMAVTVNDTGLAGGAAYGGTIAYTGPVGFPIPFNTLVTMNVGTITASPASANFFYTIGLTPPPLSATVALSSAPATGLAFTVVTSPAASWLSCTVDTNSTPATLTIAYNPASLAANATPYTGSCTVNTTNSTNTLVIPVNLTVTSEPTLSATIGGGNNPVLNITALIGGGNTTGNLTITANGLPAGTVAIPFTVGNIVSSPAWLQVTPVTGTVGAPGTTLLITINMAALGALPSPGTLDGSFTVSSPNAFNTLTVSVILKTIHPPFFDGEVLNNNGSGFYTLTFPAPASGIFAGTYAYFPNALAIYDTQLGEELYFNTFDANKGIYFYDLSTTHVWYTNPGLYPFFYDFNTNQWLEYVAGSGNGSKGSRQFYSWTYNFTNKIFVYTGLISE